MPAASPVRDANASLRRFARATNRLIAGQTFAVLGANDLSAALRLTLLACGARESAEAPDYVFVADRQAWQDALDLVGAESLVVDVQGDLTAPGAKRSAPGMRDGVRLIDGIPVVAAAPGQDPRPPLPPPAGRLAWARQYMPVATALARGLADTGLVDGRRIALSMVLEPKTAVLALLLKECGAEVSVFSHHYETDDAVAAELRRRGIPVLAESGGDAAQDRRLAVELLAAHPQVLIDDGAHVIRLAHDLEDAAERESVFRELIGAAEETTSGIRALEQLGDRLRTPVVAVNDAVMKTRFDNRYGTGQSCVFALADTLETVSPSAPALPAGFEGAAAVVVGFGPVGQGVAQYAKALGARMHVVDIDPRAETEARFAGYETGTLAALLGASPLHAVGCIVISATGVPRTITLEAMEAAADGTVFAVAGGVDDEIETTRLRQVATATRIDDHLERFVFADGHVVFVIDDGGCVNITAGEGNPIEIMDLSFAAQLQAVRFLLETAASETPLSPGLHPLPEQADREIAGWALEHRRQSRRQEAAR